ncbi:hypothetical protein B0O80DRAFT_438626 [Mortierella sp. GBAus27b]|nr:hypothetical protein B0O80DRAFT_438626 [Mortierella sp. GBAus27b]
MKLTPDSKFPPSSERKVLFPAPALPMNTTAVFELSAEFRDADMNKAECSMEVRYKRRQEERANTRGFVDAHARPSLFPGNRARLGLAWLGSRLWTASGLITTLHNERTGAITRR